MNTPARVLFTFVTMSFFALFALASDVPAPKKWQDYIRRPENVQVRYLLTRTEPGKGLVNHVLSFSKDCSRYFEAVEKQLLKMGDVMFTSEKFSDFGADVIARIEQAQIDFNAIIKTSLGSRVDRTLILKMLAYHYFEFKPVGKVHRFFKSSKRPDDLVQMPHPAGEADLNRFIDTPPEGVNIAGMEAAFSQLSLEYSNLLRPDDMGSKHQGRVSYFLKTYSNPADRSGYAFKLQWNDVTIQLHKYVTALEGVSDAVALEASLGNFSSSTNALVRAMTSFEKVDKAVDQLNRYEPTSQAKAVMDLYDKTKGLLLRQLGDLKRQADAANLE